MKKYSLIIIMGFVALVSASTPIFAMNHWYREVDHDFVRRIFAGRAMSYERLNREGHAREALLETVINGLRDQQDTVNVDGRNYRMDQLPDLERQLREVQRDLARRAEMENHARDFGEIVLRGALDMQGTEIQAAEERVTRLGQTTISEEAKTERFDRALDFIQNFFQEPRNIKYLVLGVAGIFASYFTFKYGVPIIAREIEKRLGVPQIVKETNIKSLLQRLFHRKKAVSRLDEFVGGSDLKRELVNIAVDTRNAHNYGDNLSNLGLYGPPGTGKTMFAKALALSSGLDYAIIPGASLAKLASKDALVKLNEILGWAKKSKNGIIIIFDEAESFLRNRGDASMSEGARMLVTEFLAQIEKPSHKKLMFVFLTNRPQDLDSAVLSRIGRMIHVPAPAKEELVELIKLYSSKITDVGISVDPELEDIYGDLSVIAYKGSLTGRDIEEIFTTQLVREARRSDQQKLDPTMIKQVFERYVREKQEQEQFVFA